MARVVLPLLLTLAAAAGCRPRAENPAERWPGGAAQLEPSAACAEAARPVDPARASAMWVIQVSSATEDVAPSNLTGQFYSSGNLHIVTLDTLGTDRCWHTADSLAAPVASPAEFLTNVCGPVPEAVDRRWVAVLPDTLAQVPRLAWRLQRDPPRIVPVSADSVRCWRKFTG